MLSGDSESGESADLPTFTMRVSDRARHVRLVVSGEGELVVVVPRCFDQQAIPAIIESKRAWIERARARMEARRVAGGPHHAEVPVLPERIALPALGETWEVEYRTRPGGPGRRPNPRGTVREAPGARLVVTAAAGGNDAYVEALAEWMRRRARDALVARLGELARLHGFSFVRASVRHQHTRWASCSPLGAISLNLRLLFLQPGLVDHILLHELCHTRELNHSERFWALLWAHDHDCVLHRRQAREAWRSLPDWIHARKTGHASDAGGARV
jgi:predicted metal-dependent hydrolase